MGQKSKGRWEILNRNGESERKECLFGKYEKEMGNYFVIGNI